MLKHTKLEEWLNSTGLAALSKSTFNDIGGKSDRKTTDLFDSVSYRGI
jgi:hypothetical protein